MAENARAREGFQGGDTMPLGIPGEIPEDTAGSTSGGGDGDHRWVNSLDGFVPCPRFTAAIPIDYARQHRVLGCRSEGESDTAPLQLMTADPAAIEDVADVLRRMLCVPIQAQQAPEALLLSAINRAYASQEGQAERFIDALDDEDLDQAMSALERSDLNTAAEARDLLGTEGRAPVVRLVNLLLFEAVKLGASDLHLQPYEDRVAARMRLDGVLFDLFTVPKRMQDEVISRLKILGKMNIAEKRLPQDGRATVTVGERVIDLRLSSVPTSCGERIVIRLLDKGSRLYTLPELGMPQVELEAFRQLIHLEHGLILLTGPTGSGKSTTLYAALQEINTDERNVITLEDPIEYQLSGVSQIQVNNKKGMTFARGLRSVLRQDPDIIMVGEIRDHETAELAIQSALTGHLVFSTLHTNDAASAMTRLLDLGAEPYLIASSVVAVMAQRLVRTVCPACGWPAEIAPQRWRAVGLEGPPPACAPQYGAGCDACRGTGYKGRLGLFELLVPDDVIRDHVQQRASAGTIKQAALQAGMNTLQQDGCTKVANGKTTLDEVLRVTTRAKL